MWFLINQCMVWWAKSATKRPLCWASHWSKSLLKCAKCRGIIEQFIGLHAHSQAPCDGKLLAQRFRRGFLIVSSSLSLPCFQNWDWQRSSEGDCLVFRWSRPEVNTDVPVCLHRVAGKRWAKHSRWGGMGALRKKKVVGIRCCSVSWGELTLWMASGFTCVPVKIK